MYHPWFTVTCVILAYNNNNGKPGVGYVGMLCTTFAGFLSVGSGSNRNEESIWREGR